MLALVAAMLMVMVSMVMLTAACALVIHVFCCHNSYGFSEFYVCFSAFVLQLLVGEMPCFVSLGFLFNVAFQRLCEVNAGLIGEAEEHP